MKRLRYILPIVILITAFIYWKVSNKLYVDFFPYWGSYTSKSRQASMNDGSYVYTYYPLKTDYHLHNHDLTIKFDTAWVQHAWYEKSVAGIFARNELLKTLTTVFPFKKSISNTFVFSLKSFSGNNFEKYSGGVEEHRYENYYDNIGDTIMLLIDEKDPNDSIGWLHSINGDTVVFIRASQ